MGRGGGGGHYVPSGGVGAKGSSRRTVAISRIVISILINVRIFKYFDRDSDPLLFKYIWKCVN